MSDRITATQYAQATGYLSHPDNPLAKQCIVWSERLALIQLAEDESAREHGEHIDRAMSSLANLVCMSRAATTAMVDRLEAQLLAERHVSQSDRRVTHLTITSRGMRLVREAFAFRPDDELVDTAVAAAERATANLAAAV